MATLTLHRYYLDDLLNLHKPLMKGKVLDIGGKKVNKRGSFRPPLEIADSWEYLNIDITTSPDYACSVYKIPFTDNAFDTAVFCEILEHLDKPEAALLEIFRIMKPGGKLIMTVPFLFAVHADPEDYQRWTALKLKSELSKSGFSHIEINPLGGIFAVVFDLFHVAIKSGMCQNKFLFRHIYNLFHALAPIFKYLDKKFMHISSEITTGYFIVASAIK